MCSRTYKTEVFTSRWRNQFLPNAASARRSRDPERIITKPRRRIARKQKDEDSLPPYEILDGILECLVENEMTFEDTCAKGYHPATVKRNRAASLY